MRKEQSQVTGNWPGKGARISTWKSTRRERQRALALADSFSKWLQGSGLDQELHPSLPYGCRGLSPRAIFCSFRRHVSSRLQQKCSSWTGTRGLMQDTGLSSSSSLACGTTSLAPGPTMDSVKDSTGLQKHPGRRIYQPGD